MLRVTKRTREAGSVLVLVPAAVLILMVLGTIAVDSGAVFLGQRELANAAQTAAEDATHQLGTSTFYGSGDITLVPGQAAQVADASLAAQVLGGVTLDGLPQVVVSGAQVCVSLTGRVPVVFGAALPGVGRWTEVHAHSTATATGTLGPSSSAQTQC